MEHQHAQRACSKVQRAATEWMSPYNHERPHMELGGYTPKQRLAMAA
nr:integrase core domain-containing protein [Pectobacterium polaris]